MKSRLTPSFFVINPQHDSTLNADHALARRDTDASRCGSNRGTHDEHSRWTSTYSSTTRRLIETYLLRGGFEMQVNVVSRETLLAAREHPEQYRDLLVRVAGYSDYFTKLSPKMQEEVIARTEHEL